MAFRSGHFALPTCPLLCARDTVRSMRLPLTHSQPPVPSVTLCPQLLLRECVPPHHAPSAVPSVALLDRMSTCAVPSAPQSRLHFLPHTRSALHAWPCYDHHTSPAASSHLASCLLPAAASLLPPPSSARREQREREQRERARRVSITSHHNHHKHPSSVSKVSTCLARGPRGSMPITAFASATALAIGSDGSSDSSSRTLATF